MPCQSPIPAPFPAAPPLWMSPGRTFVLALVSGLILSLLACSQKSPAAEPGAGPPTSVQIAAVPAVPIRDASEYVATLKSRRSIVLQPQIDGQVTKIFVASGDTVHQGDPIMQVDPARQEALVSSEQAGRAAKLAALGYWKQQVERLAVLFDGGAVSKQELDQARSTYESTQADVKALDAQVRQQQVQLQYYRVVAPAGGMIGDIPVRVGDRVTQATRLTTLDQNQMLEAYISVPVERAADLRPDLPVELLDNTGAVLAETRVSFISPLVNDDTQSVLLKALVGNDKGTLRAGQFARARVIFAEHSGPAIPVGAVIRLNGQHFAYLVEDTPKGPVARQRAVVVGEMSGNTYAVKAGLSPGDRIVVSGVQKVRDGSQLNPVGPEG